MPTCKEVSRVIATDELATAGWRQRLSVKLHLLMCRHCRNYARQIQEIGEATRRLFGAHLQDDTSREDLRNSILDRIPRAEKDDCDPGV